MPALNYMSADRQTILGHYTITQKSGTMAASLTAASPVASFRWAPTTTNLYAVLLRVKLAYSVLSTFGALTLDFSGTIARGFTVDFSAGNTQANMSALTGMVRSNIMGRSAMGTRGPQIATTAAMSGQTYTLDTDYMHAAVFNNNGTTVGVGGQVTLYDRALEGQHPIVFDGTTLCGYVVRNISATPTGTFAFYCTWEWAEVFQSAV